MSLPMLQVALDNQSMSSAYETTRLIAEEVDIIEVGTILCVAEGVRAVRDLKALYPHKIVLADAKIADAGKILSRMCFEANADWVTVICCADINTTKGALEVATVRVEPSLQKYTDSVLRNASPLRRISQLEHSE